MRRYALRDDQWERIKDLLPGREGHVGVTAKNNRLFVEAVLYRHRRGVGVFGRRPSETYPPRWCSASSGSLVRVTVPLRAFSN
jgi:transposase